MKYVRNQNISLSFVLTLDKDLDVADAISIAIEFRCPSGAVGSRPVTDPPDLNNITCEVPANTLSERGTYYVWPKIVFSDTEVYYGTATVLEMVEPWENQ